MTALLAAACFAGTAAVATMWGVAAVLARLEADEDERRDDYPQDS